MCGCNLERIEIVCNGKVVHSQEADTKNGNPVVLNFSLPVVQSSWICARRMDKDGHRSHTAPVFVSVGELPVRASAEDAEYFVNWITGLLAGIKDNGPWRTYFSNNIEEVRARYTAAADIYRKIASEALQLKSNNNNR